VNWEKFLFFWGVWILVPLIVDVAQALRDAWQVFRSRRFARLYPPLPRRDLPKVSVLIPAFNEQLDIDRCITSLKAQTYPHHLIEVIVINDGSTDRTEQVVQGHINGDAHWNGHIRLHNRVIPAREFGGVMTLLQGQHRGKPAAVNMGLAKCRGELIMAIDSDVVLEPEAVEQAVSAFRFDPNLVAATAHLIIDSNLLVQHDGKGRISLDDHDLPLTRRLSLNERILAGSQFLEYLQSFRIGRHAEAIRDELFTLSGACAVFRKEALRAVNGYRGRTVSEDTDVTLSLRRHVGKIGYLPQVRVHLAPTVSWEELFSQRVRWQRGELEVMAMNADRIGRGEHYWKRSLPARLRRDHALALLRLVWGFLMPMFPLLGYDPGMVAQASALMYILYVLADLMQFLAAWPICAESERRLLRESAIYLPVLPLYRMVVYFFRLSGLLKTLSDQPEWTTPTEWLRGLKSPRAQRMTGWVDRAVEFWAD
jgi:biofilm PGA synthesis N-glycosyltransferase PgaC